MPGGDPYFDTLWFGAVQVDPAGTVAQECNVLWITGMSVNNSAIMMALEVFGDGGYVFKNLEPACSSNLVKFIPSITTGKIASDRKAVYLCTSSGFSKISRGGNVSWNNGASYTDVFALEEKKWPR